MKYELWLCHPESDCYTKLSEHDTFSEATEAEKLEWAKGYDDGCVHYEIRKDGVTLYEDDAKKIG